LSGSTILCTAMIEFVSAVILITATSIRMRICTLAGVNIVTALTSLKKRIIRIIFIFVLSCGVAGCTLLVAKIIKEIHEQREQHNQQ